MNDRVACQSFVSHSSESLMVENPRPSQFTSPRLQFGLGAWCVFVALAGAALGWLGRAYWRGPEFLRSASTVSWRDANQVSRHAFVACNWRLSSPTPTLVYCLVMGKELDNHRHGLSSSSKFDRLQDGRRDQIHLFDTGLAFEGRLAEITPNHRVWVFTKDRLLKPIELTRDELAQITPETYETIYTTNVWKEKIEPVWEREGYTNSEEAFAAEMVRKTKSAN
jgi:hypothetical protein